MRRRQFITLVGGAAAWRTKAAKAALISRLVLALSPWICSPRALAAASTSLNVVSALAAFAGLTSTATRVAAGTTHAGAPTVLLPTHPRPNWLLSGCRPIQKRCAGIAGNGLQQPTWPAVFGIMHQVHGRRPNAESDCQQIVCYFPSFCRSIR